MTEGNRELVTKDDMAESYSNEVEINENTLANIANENIRKRLLDRMDPNFGLLDKLLANKAIDRNELQIVKSRDTTYERNVRLFDIITEKRKYRELFEALRDSNQNHLVNYVTANGVYSKRYYKVWPLTSREMNILDCNQEFLVDTIDVSNNELIGKLYAIGFLNKRQREHLCKLQHSYEKTETLLDMLQRSSLNGYSQMIVCLLEMKQSHIAQLLVEGGVAVPVHNTIDGEGEAQNMDEEELVTQIQIILQDRPVGKALRVLETLQLRLIAGKRGQSIVLYILCKSLYDLSLLFEILKTGELRKRIQRFFNDLVQRSDRIVATTILPKNDFEKYKKYFEATSVSIAGGNCELVTNDDMTESYSNEDCPIEEQAVNAPIVSGSSSILKSLRMDNIEKILEPLPGFVELTYEPCMITFDDDPTTARAKMPCGHVISTLAMKEYCKDVIKRGRFKFPCPDLACCHEWEYFLVRHVACLTEEEMRNFDNRLAENFFNNKGLQKCPRCQTFCYRQPGLKNCVRCQMCTRALCRNYDFCWICLREWKLYTSLISCGNQGCYGKDRRIETLANCKAKIINGKECPSIRACPSCGILITHTGKCAHIACPDCPGLGFCFLCLKEKENGIWKCRPYLDSCPVAPRQIEFPEYHGGRQEPNIGWANLASCQLQNECGPKYSVARGPLDTTCCTH